MPNVIDFYREGFLRSIDVEVIQSGKCKVVIDFNHCPASNLLPALLNEMGCEVITLNAYIEEDRGTRKTREKSESLQQLSKIVTALEAQAGFWLDPTTEGIILVDETGKVCSPIELLSLMVSFMLDKAEKGVFVVPISAPSVIEQIALEKGCTVRRTKSSERSMIEASLSSEVILAGSMDGRFAFPMFQNAFDGMFAIVKTIELAAAAGISISQKNGKNTVSFLPPDQGAVRMGNERQRHA